MNRGSCVFCENVLLRPSNLIGIALEPSTHVAGDVIGIETAAIAVAEDGGGDIVVADNDETTIVGYVEYIQSADLLCHGQLLLCDRGSS